MTAGDLKRRSVGLPWTLSSPGALPFIVSFPITAPR